MRLTTGGHDDPAVVYANRWWTLGTLCVALIVIGVDNTILNVALPSIVRDLGATGSQLQLMVDAYTIIFACLLLTAGSLGDRYGRRHALLFGLAWFGVFSGVASIASSPTQLIIARGLMGLGGAFIFPTTLSILTNTFREPGERATAIGIWAGVSGVGIALGPLAGGLLVEQFGWGSVFLVNLPICAIAILLTLRFVPNTSDPAESPLDPLGALFSIVGLLFLLYGIIQGPDQGWSASEVTISIGVGIVFLVLFAWWEWRNPTPMLDVRFFKSARFSAASATITLTFFGFFASTFLLTQYFQFILGYSPLKAGVMILPTAVGLMVASPLSPRLVDRWGTKWVVVVGLSFVAFGMACYASNTIMSNFCLGLLVRLHDGIGFGIMQRARDRVDHGLAATEPRRRGLRGQRHDPPDRRRARRRGDRQHLRGALPLRDRATGVPAGRRAQVGPRVDRHLAADGHQARRRGRRPARARRQPRRFSRRSA